MPLELGIIISIFGSAALGTAIAMAMMLFFSERYELYQKHVEEGLRHLESEVGEKKDKSKD